MLTNKSFLTFSIIVPVYNSAKTIKPCIESLLLLNYPSYEIIIIDDGSTDNSLKICEKFSQIKIIRTANRGPSRARNIGIKEAEGDIIAFTDSDCIVHPEWLLELNKGFSKKSVVGVGGNQVSPVDESDFGKCTQETFTILGFATSYMKTPAFMTEIKHNPSCNSAYRKENIKEMGGFNESLWPGEDVDLDLRLIRQGHTLVRNPKAIVAHYRPQSLSALASMMRRYGGSAFFLLKSHGFFRPLQYLPFTSAILLLCIVSGLIYVPTLIMVLSLFSFSLLFLLFLIKMGISKRTAFLFLLILHIILHWHLGFFKAMTRH